MGGSRGRVLAVATSTLPRPPAVARVLRQVTATARRHAMFEPGSLVVVAVSGGPDSICLLHAMARLRRLFALDLACFHFDHGLRPESERDAVYVRRQAASLRVPCHLRRAGSQAGRGGSLGAGGRGRRGRAVNEGLRALRGGGAAVG